MRADAGIKTITLIRHGVALHNVYDAETGARPNDLDPSLTDPPLVVEGEMQARALGEKLRRRGMVVGAGENGTIDLVVCSPLMRCLQTASLVFPSHFSNSSLESPAMEVDDHRLHVLDLGCSLFCHGDLREAFGVRYTDKRGPLSRLISEFPAVRYHPLLTENDEDWRHDYRETRGDVSRRIHNFFLWLTRQPHGNVAIVTHGVWMECALMNYCPEALDFGKKRVYNCDVYSGNLISSPEHGVVMRNMEKL